MKGALKAAKSPNVTHPPLALLPKESWNGMSTISDEVLLRIIETSSNHQTNGFPPRECRIHCKNYFHNINLQYEQMLSTSILLANNGQNWRDGIIELLDYNHSRHIEAAEGVYQMLELAKQLLEQNSRAIFPK